MIRTGAQTDRPRVLIVGGGFGGLAAARALRGVDADVTLIDRENHHVFQPLLYQVATGSLSPASISAPIRTTLRGRADCDVVLARATGVDLETKRLLFEKGAAVYDYLILAAGVRHDYFGNDEWESVAPGLKTLSDATEIRRRMLLAFETAEHEGDPAAQRAALTFAIVGGGPTGVELAGAIQEIASNTLPKEYAHIDTTTARILVLEGGDRLLAAFPPELSERARRDLEEMGVEVRLGSRVTDVRDAGVRLGEEFIATQNVFWAAGVRASPITSAMGAPLDQAGRVIVEPDLSLAGHPEVFVAGDMASFTPAGGDAPVPGVAQAALQMGRHAGLAVRRRIEGGDAPGAFVYRDKGSMAIVGKNRAVVALGGRRFAGFPAWALWAGVHIAFLVGFRNRLRVLFNWFFAWLINSHDARLILGDARLRLRRPRGEGFEPAPDRDGAG